MTVSRVNSAQPGPVNAKLVKVEADSSVGLYGFTIVGLPAKEVDEAKDRVPTSIKNSGIKSPKSKNRRIVISLTPATLKKDGSQYDLPVAVAYLLASEEIKDKDDFLKSSLFIGELSLSGEILPVRGAISVSKLCLEKGIQNIFVPEENKDEAAIIEGVNVYPVNHLKEIIDFFKLKELDQNLNLEPYTLPKKQSEKTLSDLSLSYVLGQDLAKRALLIAGAGSHNIALFGPPGTGKTMLAKGFSEILPELSLEDSVEVTGIHSYTGQIDEVIVEAPFRNPHHSASYVSIVGGGNNIKPGEITLAHKGVLFLDEFPEFDKKVLESLRQPLEDKYVVVSRAKGTQKFPADIILLAAMNPCPCGYLNSNVKECICKEIDILKYKRKISGPIIDRIDMWVEVTHIPYENFLKEKKQQDKTVFSFRDKIITARNLQQKRSGKLNSNLKNKELDDLKITTEAEKMWIETSKRLQLSPRSMQRIKKLARTISDLEDSEIIDVKHILEAFQYRAKVFEA